VGSGRLLVGVRSRWAAIGAACAVALGAGGFGVVNAVVSSGDKSVFVPVSPVRVLDTRSSSKIVNGTRLLRVEGAITLADGTSQQVVPVAASAVAVNVTATSTAKNGDYGFVTVFPCVSASDAVPNASSLNFENRVDIANALNVSTSSNGSICLYVYGTADLIIDVAGYYIDHNHDDRYYTETEVDTKLTAKANTSDLLPLPPGSSPITVDATGNTGWYTSMAIGVNGFPVISYHDGTNSDLRVAACSTATCSEKTLTTVDATGNTGYNTSIAIGVNGFPVISYYDNTNGDLRVAACSTATCSEKTLTTVDATGDTGWYTSIAIGVNGFPVISYYDGTNGNLRVAACSTATCSAATLTTVDATGDTGLYTSMAIGVNGFPVISYYDATNSNLRVAVPWWVVGGR